MSTNLEAVQQELSELGQKIERLGEGLGGDIKKLQEKMVVACNLGHWHTGNDCPYCEKRQAEIDNDNCKSPAEICEDGECDCDEGECVALEAD